MQRRFWSAAVAVVAVIAFSGQVTKAGASNDDVTVLEADQTQRGPSGLPIPRFVALKSDEVRARFGPSFDYPVAYEFHRQGLPLKVIGEDRDNIWRRVEDRDGQRMWIHRSMLMANDSAIIQTEDAVLRATPSADSRGRARLGTGVMTQIETCEDQWCRIRAGEFRGWIERDILWGAPL